MEQTEQLRARLEALEMVFTAYAVQIARNCGDAAWNATLTGTSDLIMGPFHYREGLSDYEKKRREAGMALIGSLLETIQNSP